MLEENDDKIPYLQYRLWIWGTVSRLVDRGLTATVTNQSSVSTQFYLINSNRRHAVGAVQISGQQTDITKCRNVSMVLFQTILPF